MKLKSGVCVTGIQPEMILAIIIAQRVYDDLDTLLVITSCVEGKHSATSLHYAGAAVDLRTRDMSKAAAKRARDDIAAALTSDYDVLWETNHLHLEWQPRRR